MTRVQKSRKRNSDEILCDYAFLLHPSNPKGIKVIGRDIRIVRHIDGKMKWAESRNGEISYCSRERIASSLIALTGDALKASYWLDVVDQAFLYSEWLDTHDDSKIKMIIDENIIKPLAFKSDKGFAYRKLPFDPDIKSNPTIWESEVLKRFIYNREAMLAFIGSLFDANSDREKYLWIVGIGGCGKSSFCDTLSDCFGNAGTVITASKLNDRWANSTIFGSRLCIVGEATSETVVSERFKSLTGDKYQDIEMKGKDLFKGLINTKFLLHSNDYPEMRAANEHRRRCILTEMQEPDGFERTRTMPETVALMAKGLPYFLALCCNAYENGGMRKVDLDIYDQAATDPNYQKTFDKYFKINLGTPKEPVECSTVKTLLMTKESMTLSEFLKLIKFVDKKTALHRKKVWVKDNMKWCYTNLILK